MSTATTTGFKKLSTTEQTYARQIYANLTARYQSYLDECESYREEGHRPRYCEHGTDQWTDWDNICGGCEDGQSNEYVTDKWRIARYTAIGISAEVLRIFRLYGEIMTDASGDTEMQDMLWVLVTKQVNKVLSQYGLELWENPRKK